MGSSAAAWTRSLHGPVACLLLSQRLSDLRSFSLSLSPLLLLPFLSIFHFFLLIPPVSSSPPPRCDFLFYFFSLFMTGRNSNTESDYLLLPLIPSPHLPRSSTSLLPLIRAEDANWSGLHRASPGRQTTISLLDLSEMAAEFCREGNPP